MSLRTHLFLLLFSVAIGGATLTFANHRWHTSLEAQYQATGTNSITLEKLRHVSSSLSRFLVTYDLVVFSGITYLGEDALLQLKQLDQILGEIPRLEVAPHVILNSKANLKKVQSVLRGVIQGPAGDVSEENTQQAEEHLSQVVEELASLIQLAEKEFKRQSQALVMQTRLQETTQTASLIAYGTLLFMLVVWSTRRIAGPVDAISDISNYQIGAAIPVLQKKSGPREFQEIARSIHALIVSLEETVEMRTAELAGQVAEHMKTQDSLKVSNTDLAKSMKDLRRTQRALIEKERLTALGELVSGISHDFNNILVPIISYSSILIDDPSIEAEERNELLAIIKTAAEDAARVIERLRAFNRKADGTQESEVIEIDEVVEDAVAMAEPRWKVQDDFVPRQINVVCELGSAGTIMGSTAEIRQALINLLFNSVDALPEGGEIRVSTSVEGKFVVVAVTDNGTGMSAKTLESCQKPFFSTKLKRGTGLGLAMVNNAALSHFGRVEIESTPGTGTSVRLLLPCETSKVQKNEISSSKKVVSADLRILLVDDDEFVLNAHAALLRHMGISPQISSRPLETLAGFEAGQFDIVITDLRMPEISGLEFARQVRSICPNIRIFLLTAFEGGLANTSEIASIDQILLKPISVERLKDAILLDPADSQAAL
jgi:signal transduction histidine kinase/ActR/RegA family two-component response regulator